MLICLYALNLTEKNFWIKYTILKNKICNKNITNYITNYISKYIKILIRKMNYIDRYKPLPILSRISPLLFLIIVLFNCIIFPSYRSFYLFVSYILLILSNYIIKNIIAKPLYDLVNKTTLPILGRGARPPCASSCQFILDNKLSSSFGMPSGHSQIAWAVATYIIARIITNNLKFTNKDNKSITIFKYFWLIFICMLILLCALYISYSRVYIEKCHTIEQVTVGGILGIVSGFLIYYFENDALILIKTLLHIFY